MKRYALVSIRSDARCYGTERAVQTIERYMPGNYRVIAVLDREEPIELGNLRLDGPFVVLMGEDNAGWTLDDYVIPRLASGLHPAQEIDLSHPVMKQVPEQEEVAWIGAHR